MKKECFITFSTAKMKELDIFLFVLKRKNVGTR